MSGTNMMDLRHLEIIQACRGRIVVGLSGGMDSVVLLHQLKLLDGIRLLVVHVDHQLQSESSDWAVFCSELCKRWQIDFLVERVNVKTEGNLEAAARQARYAAFEKHLQPNDLLLLAHHQDDQVESIFLSLLRGDSPMGLKGMPGDRPVGAARLLRPLLSQTRSQLAVYAASAGLAWVEDKTNQDPHYDRNFLRLEIIPLIKSRWPQMETRILAALARTETSAAYLDAETARRLDACLILPRVLDLTFYQRLDEFQQIAVLRTWLMAFEPRSPTHKALAAASLMFLDAGSEASPLLTWQGINIRRYQGRLYLYPKFEMASGDTVFSLAQLLESDSDIDSDTDQGLVAELGGRLSLFDADDQPVDAGQVAGLSVRFEMPRMKKLFQTHKVPPFFRSQLPLVCLGEVLLAVPAMPEYGITMISTRVWYETKMRENWRLEWRI